MAKKLKPIEEEEIKEQIIEVTEEAEEPIVEAEMPKIYIPDIPAQMVEEKKLDLYVPEQPKVETEIEFLQRILFIQENGGFGRHLNGIINERIKSLS
jgi:hypothetical protein